jgi:hypothetical protein
MIGNVDASLRETIVQASVAQSLGRFLLSWCKRPGTRRRTNDA